MRFVFLAITITLGCAAVRAEAQDVPEPLLARQGDICAFSGRVSLIDLAQRTVVVSLGTSFLFHVPVTTPIAFRKGSAADFTALKTGQTVEVVARREAKDWTATKVTLPDRGIHVIDSAPARPFFGGEFSVRTTAGKTITGLAAQRYVLYAPPEQWVNRGIDLGRHSGLFLLSIRPDGTVASVKILQSLTVRELDERSIGRLSRFKFRPGSLAEARVPISYASFKTR